MLRSKLEVRVAMVLVEEDKEKEWGEATRVEWPYTIRDGWGDYTGVGYGLDGDGGGRGVGGRRD